MIVVAKVLDQGIPADPLEDLLAERGWVPRPGPAFVMTAGIADIPASPDIDVRLDPEPDVPWLTLYRYPGAGPAADRADAADGSAFRSPPGRLPRLARYHYLLAP